MFDKQDPDVRQTTALVRDSAYATIGQGWQCSSGEPAIERGRREPAVSDAVIILFIPRT